MLKLSRIVTSIAAFASVLACRGGPEATGPGATGPGSSASSSGTGASPGTRAGTCQPSSVVTTTTCAPRTLPPSNASSPSGCKSDAECKSGVQGRCVDNRGARRYGALPPPPRNLLAEPPPPPPETVCTYDHCRSNAECGAGSRCSCGVGEGRNGCVPLDSCLRDAECGIDALCSCGTSGGPNACSPGNCRTDADCGGLKCDAGEAGSFCHTARDTCRTNEDCASPQQFRICDYDRGTKAWACRVIPPRPPG